jgi:cobalt/nickel transport system ATP-binding protein
MRQLSPSPQDSLVFEDISYSYNGSKQNALHNITLSFQAGQRVALIGRNGSGKSTLMLLANGTLQPDKGSIFFNGTRVRYDKKSLRFLRENVGIVFQNPEDQLFSASVMQDISLGPLNLGLSEEEARQRVNEVVAFCQLEHLVERPTHALSGGEKTRVALAGILAMKPRFLFADEITNSLDPWMRNQILSILNNWVTQGNTVVLSIHDWKLAEAWGEKVIWLDTGEILKSGSASEVFTNAELPDIPPFN